jgi:hypothetical protein
MSRRSASVSGPRKSARAESAEPSDGASEGNASAASSGHLQNAGSRLQSADSAAAHRCASNARPFGFRLRRARAQPPRRREELLAKVRQSRAEQRLPQQRHEPQTRARGAGDVPPVGVELAVEHALVDLVVVHAVVVVGVPQPRLGLDLGVDAFLESQRQHRQHLLWAERAHGGGERRGELCAARQPLGVRAHLAERLEAPAQDGAGGGAEAVERRRHHRKRRRPRRSVPEPERRLERVRDADHGRGPRGRVASRGARGGDRLDAFAHHVRVHAARDERRQARSSLHRNALVHGVEHLHQLVARRRHGARAGVRGVQLVQAAHRRGVRPGKRHGERRATRRLRGGGAGERRDRRCGGGGGGIRRRRGAAHESPAGGERGGGVRRGGGRRRAGLREERDERVACVLREHRLGEVQQADDRGGHLAGGGLAELAQDSFQRAEEMQALRSRRLRALLRRFGARGAVHVRELARRLTGRAQGLDGHRREGAAGGVRRGRVSERSKRLANRRRRLLAHLGPPVDAQVADSGEGLGAVLPVLEDRLRRRRRAQGRHEQADAAHHTPKRGGGLLRGASGRHEHFGGGGQARQHGRGRGVLKRGGEHSEHRARLLRGYRRVRALQGGHRRREHRGGRGGYALLLQDVRHRLEHGTGRLRFRLPRTTVPVPQLRHGVAIGEPGERERRHDAELSSRRGAVRSETRARVKMRSLERRRREKTAAALRGENRRSRENRRRRWFQTRFESQASTDIK